MKGGRMLRRRLDMKGEGRVDPIAVDPPQKSIKHQIKHPKKKAFDYRVIMCDGVAYFVVSADTTPEKAVRMYSQIRPAADLVDNYERGFCRFNVVSQEYELCENGPGAFPVHIWIMEE